MAGGVWVEEEVAEAWATGRLLSLAETASGVTTTARFCGAGPGGVPAPEGLVSPLYDCTFGWRADPAGVNCRTRRPGPAVAAPDAAMALRSMIEAAAAAAALATVTVGWRAITSST